MEKIAPRDNPCYCINFRRVAGTLTKFYDRAFAPLGLTTNQFSLLNDIHLLGACNKSELARFSRLDRTTIIRSLRALLEKGLVEDTVDADGKIQGVRLTEDGRSAIAAGMPAWKSAQRRIRSILGEEHLAVLKQILVDVESLNETETPE